MIEDGFASRMPWEVIGAVGVGVKVSCTLSPTNMVGFSDAVFDTPWPASGVGHNLCPGRLRAWLHRSPLLHSDWCP